MKKIKLTFPYPTQPIIRQSPSFSKVWGDFEFLINEEVEQCDYWFVFNMLLHPLEKAICPPENVVFISAEPYSVMGYNPSFLNQFAHVITCQQEIKHSNRHFLPQAHPWFVEKTFDEVVEDSKILKTKAISIITSNKQFTDGHKRRFDFTMKLKEYFGDEIDLFGRGVKDFDQKWDVLAPYKYSIPIENSKYEYYFSEKIFDCYLAQTFPFYDGCPNLEQYFPKAAFERINILDFDASKRIIENVLKDKDHYHNHLAHLIKAKHTYLNNYNIFPFIISFITKNLNTGILSPQEIRLKQKHFNFNFLSQQVVRKIKSKLK